MSTETDDAGITLVELIVYVAVSALLLGFLAVTFVNGIGAQAQATDRDNATGATNAVSSSILASIRNSTDFTVTGAGQTLIAKVARPGAAPVCRAWAVTTDGDVRYKESAAVFSTADVRTWSRLVDGRQGAAVGALAVRSGSNPDGTPRFARVDADGDGRADAFARSGATLSFAIAVTRGETTVSATNAVASLASNTATGSPCW